MECKFLQNGISIAYDHVVKPCCIWKYDQHYQQQNHAKQVNLINWHDSSFLKNAQETMAKEIWPRECSSCQNQEYQDKHDSVRLNGNRSYNNYTDEDIILEIRPGNVCNFACQTCWPEASSRVEQFQHRAGLINRINIDSSPIKNFDFLIPVKHRIKTVVLLGGEPFYDKNCRHFLSWAVENLSADIIIYTNGSTVDWSWVSKYSGKIILVFSIDAVGTSAEYIRFGTCWSTVLENFKYSLNLKNIETRANITLSVYNYHYLPDIISLLLEQWPSVVTFGSPKQPYLLESVVPLESRNYVVDKINIALILLLKNKNLLGLDQWHNTVNALKSIINNLKTTNWDQEQYKFLLDYINKLDSVKNCKIQDHCPDTVKILNLLV